MSEPKYQEAFHVVISVWPISYLCANFSVLQEKNALSLEIRR